MDSPTPEAKSGPASTDATGLPDEYAPSSQSKGKFRFKRSSSSSRHRRHRHHHDHHEYSDHHTHTHSSRSHSHSHRHKRHHSDDRPSGRPSKRRHRHKDRSLSPPPPHNGIPGLSPSGAFRESLFDALGDDEGAAYWESVYGQPIHTYAVPNIPKGPEGELEQMTEEEYAAYVRARMWERTREGMLEEQERIHAERARAKENEKAQQHAKEERRAFERAMEESLARGTERRKRKVWEGVWEAYLRRWDEIARMVDSSSASGGNEKDTTATHVRSPTEERKPLRNLLFWPVESGKRKDVSPQAVEEFMRRAPPAQDDLLATLKAERVRWHPDKMQHRYGVLGIDEGMMRSVTEVFQIVDRMWSEEREKGEKSQRYW